MLARSYLSAQVGVDGRGLGNQQVNRRIIQRKAEWELITPKDYFPTAVSKSTACLFWWWVIMIFDLNYYL